MRDNLAASLRLLLVTDDSYLDGHDAVALCQRAVAGGVTAVQLRLKRADDRTFCTLARRLRQALDVPLFINDRVDIALAAEATGVHLGPDDLSPTLARRIVPAGFVLGASVGSHDELERARSADYWGIGPLRGSLTKVDAGVALGWEGARALLQRAGSRPCVIIGGVTPDDVAAARTEGFAGVAVSSGILSGTDVKQAAEGYSRSEKGEGRREKGEARRDDR